MADRVVFKKDVGITIKVIFKDADGNALNIGGAITKHILFEKAGSRVAAFTTDGSDGSLTYVTVAGDLDSAGTEKYQGFVTFVNGSKWTTEVELLVVQDPVATQPNKLYMSKSPIGPLGPVWAEVQADVGLTGIVTSNDSYADWVDSAHQTAIGLFTTERLFVQIDRTEFSQSLDTMLANLDALLDLYGPKMWGINFCVRADDDTEGYDIMRADPGARRLQIQKLNDYTKGRFPSLVTTVSLDVITAINVGDIAAVMANLKATSVDVPMMWEVYGSQGAFFVNNARYQGFFDETLVQFGKYDFISEGAYKGANIAGGSETEVIQSQAMQRFYDLAKAKNCMLINNQYPYDQTWYDATRPDFGLRTAAGVKREAWALWNTLRDK